MEGHVVKLGERTSPTPPTYTLVELHNNEKVAYGKNNDEENIHTTVAYTTLVSYS